MDKWFLTRGRDLAIRAAGVASLGISWASFHALYRDVGLRPNDAATTLWFAIAAIGFVAAAAGAAALSLGRHLFDQVQVSRRWQRLPLEREQGFIVRSRHDHQ
jgi:hypothetical protein